MIKGLFPRDDGQPMYEKEAETLQVLALINAGRPKLAASLAFANTKLAKALVYLIGGLILGWYGVPQQGFAALARLL